MSKLDEIAHKHNTTSIGQVAALSQIPAFRDMVATAVEREREAEQVRQILENDRFNYGITEEQQGALIVTGNYLAALSVVFGR